MPGRRLSRMPTAFVLFLAPLAVPALVAVLVSLRGEAVPAQGLAEKRPELPASRPTRAPQSLQSFPQFRDNARNLGNKVSLQPGSFSDPTNVGGPHNPTRLAGGVNHPVGSESNELPRKVALTPPASLKYNPEPPPQASQTVVHHPRLVAPRPLSEERARGIDHPFVKKDPLKNQHSKAVVNASHNIAPPEVLPETQTHDSATPAADTNVLSDLRPVGEIDLLKAIELPPVATGDSPNLVQPQDQAQQFLSHRTAVNFGATEWTPWQPDRDSYPFHHFPLYFEDPNLERCGRGFGCFTTVVSVAHFYGTIPVLPYCMTAEPPRQCVQTLPDCPACQRFGCDAYLPPWSWKAAVVQAAATVGAVFIVP